MIEETQTGLAGEHSRWWYVTAFILVWSMVSTVLFTSYLLGFEWVGPTIVVLTYLSMVILLLNPIAIYFDATAINRSGNEWQPNTILYVAGAVAGLVVPFLEFVVSLVYLLRRHRYLGTP